MSHECPRCRTTLVEVDDDVNDYELEGKQVRHTVKRCASAEAGEVSDGWHGYLDEGHEWRKC